MWSIKRCLVSFKVWKFTSFLTKQILCEIKCSNNYFWKNWGFSKTEIMVCSNYPFWQSHDPSEIQKAIYMKTWWGCQIISMLTYGTFWQKTKGGIFIQDCHLPQQPTISKMTFEVLKSVLPLFLRVWWTVTLTLYTDKWWWRFSLFGQKSWNAILKYVSLKVWMLTKFWNKPSNFTQRFAKKKNKNAFFFQIDLLYFGDYFDIL